MMFSVFHLSSSSKITVLVFLIQSLTFICFLKNSEIFSYCVLNFDFIITLGVDTLRCLALATVDEPIPPSKMDLENSEKFAEYEVCTCLVS